MPELNTHPAYPLSTLRCVPRDTQRKTRGRADRYSFLVRNFHPLLHAGLSRRTAILISLTTKVKECNRLLTTSVSILLYGIIYGNALLQQLCVRVGFFTD